MLKNNTKNKINTWDDIFDNIESEMDCVVPLKVVNYLEKYYRKPIPLGYICPVTKTQCDDECCTSPETCNIDNKEIEYPMSAD
jgi:hypothetical protein